MAIRQLRTKKGSLIRRSSYGVGKEMPGGIYIHKNYAHCIGLDLKKLDTKLRKVVSESDFKYNCLKYTPKTGEIIFQEGPDFDSAREPHVGRMFKMIGDKITECRPSNTIWHHKWLWVKDDYKGFDVNESYEWSKLWLSKFPEAAKGTDKTFNEQLTKFGLSKYQGLGMTSETLDKLHPGWRNQTTSDGKHNTQIKGTLQTYQKFAAWVELNFGTRVSILDASSGEGHGTVELRKHFKNVDDVEPFPRKGRIPKPTYTDYKQINKSYDLIVSNAVINVIPDDWRDKLIFSMAKLLKKGGVLFINTRGTDVKTGPGEALDSEWEKLISKGKNFSYQRGFKKGELIDYCQQLLGPKFEVKSGKPVFGTAGFQAAVLITRIS